MLSFNKKGVTAVRRRILNAPGGTPFENHLYKLQAREATAPAPLIKVYTLHDAVQAQNNRLQG